MSRFIVQQTLCRCKTTFAATFSHAKCICFAVFLYILKMKTFLYSLELY